MKYLLDKSEKLKKQLEKNKSIVNERKDNLRALEEMCQLLDETANKFEKDTKKFESHFMKKYPKWLLIIAVIIIATISIGFGNYWFRTEGENEKKAQYSNYFNDYLLLDK
jgi:predicted nuclease with TOPRIM domain